MMGKSDGTFARKSKVFLDSRDLINLVDERGPCDSARFTEFLGNVGELALTFGNAIELVPADRNPMLTSYRASVIQKLPHTFVRAGDLFEREIENAMKAFRHGSEPEPVDIFCESLLESTGSVTSRSVSEMILRIESRRDLRFTGFENQLNMLLTNGDLFRFRDDQIESLRRGVQADRINREKSFERRLDESLARWARRAGVEFQQIQDFRKWLMRDPMRSPGLLLFESAYDLFEGNLGQEVTSGDIYDFHHVSIVPYVEASTLDGNKRTFVEEGARRLEKGSGKPFAASVFSDLPHLVSTLAKKL